MSVIDYIEPWTRRVYLSIDTVGVDFQPMDAYKEMRTLRRTDEGLRKADVFMLGLGKELKGPGKFTERFVKLLDGTRFVPYDVTQVLNVIGTVITDDGQEGVACFDRDPLTITTRVDINYIPPQVEVIEITSESNVTEQDKADIINGVLTTDNSGNEDFNTVGGAISHLKHLEYRIFIDTESTEPEVDQDGSQHHPYSNETTAIDYAEAHGLLHLKIKSDIDLTRDVKNFYITSTNIKKVDTNANNLEGSRFSHIELFGNYTGYVTAQDCNLTGGNLHGFFQNCAIGSAFKVPNLGSALVKDCTEFTEGFISPPSFDIGGVDGTARLHLKSFIGGASIINCTKSTDEVKIVATGEIRLENTCTDGNVIIFGNVKPVDNSGPNCNVMWFNIDPTKLDNIPEDVSRYVRV